MYLSVSRFIHHLFSLCLFPLTVNVISSFKQMKLFVYYV